MVKVIQGIPAQESGSRARAFHHCIQLPLWPQEQAQNETVNEGDFMSDVHSHRGRLPVARYNEANLEVIVDFREARVRAMKMISHQV